MMDTKQPEALRLADMIESLPPTGLGGDGIHLDIHFVEPTDLAAAELRRLHEEVKYIPALERVLDKQGAKILRLHEVNQELLEALSVCIHHGDGLSKNHQSYLPPSVLLKAKAAIAKATGEQA
jgi:hypothetical protein